MALRDTFNKDFTEELNRFSLVTLDFSGLYFSLFKPDDETGVTGRIRITALDTYVYRGTYVVPYTKLDFSTFVSRLPRSPQLPFRSTTHEMLPFLLEQVGLRLTEEEVTDLPVIDNGDDTFTVTLEATDMSKGWSGRVDLICHYLPHIQRVSKYISIDW